jgi:hypothetical protein
MEVQISQVSKRDKRSKFVELANKRVNRVLKDMALVANLANRRNYEYDDDQAQRIVRALQNELDVIKHSFNHKGSSSGTTFEL